MFGLLVPDAAPGQTTQPATALTGEEIARRIDAFEANFDAANRLSGVLLIARGGEVILQRAYGHADVEKGVKNELNTRIGIASITKIMTSIVLGQLISEGKLSYTDTIERWLPDFPPADLITIEHLARHRAGIPHRVTTAEDEAEPLSAADIVKRAKAFPLLFEPGSQSVYSSAGYTVLARCIELATDQTYADLLAERIFKPAGMNDTFDSVAGRAIPGAAPSFVPARGELVPAPKKDLAFLAGAGSVFSTAGDLWKFVQALKAGKLRARFEQFGDQGRVAWTGASNGYFAFLDTHPADELTCIWVGNTWGGCAGALREALPALCRGEDVKPRVRPELTPTPAAGALQEYVGAYESRLGASSAAEVRAGELWYGDSLLLAIGPDRFWHQPWHCEVAFVRDEAGKVTAIERRDGGEPVRWPRVPDEAAGSP